MDTDTHSAIVFQCCSPCVSACLAGTRAETSSRVTGKEGFEADGIQGLKALGVRELSYRLAFLANHVAPTNPRVRSRVRILYETWLSLHTCFTMLQAKITLMCFPKLWMFTPTKIV